MTTSSEPFDCPKMNQLTVQGETEDKIVLKVQSVKSASDKAVELDPYLAPHKEVIQSRYI